jgi:hypothetical protein
MSGSSSGEARREHYDTNATDYAEQTVVFPAHTICDLDETYKPRDILDALAGLRFRHGTKILRIDAQVRDYLMTAVSALSGHDRK